MKQRYHSHSVRLNRNLKHSLMMMCITAFALISATIGARAATLVWNFGTTTPLATPSSGTLTNFSGGTFSLGNSLGTVSAPINTTSPSNVYTGASAGENLGNAVKTGALDTSTSAYYSVSFTANAGFTLSIANFDFGSRSTSTGPISFSLRSSLDNFGSDIFTGSVANTGTWAFKDNAPFSLSSAVSGGGIELRLYTFGGSGSPASGTQNNRMDDVTIDISAVAVGSTPNYFDTNGSAAGIGRNGGTAAWDTTTTNWNPLVSGTGTPKLFDPAQAAIFGASGGGASGTVIVASGGVTANGGIQFDVTGYTISGASVTLGSANPTMTVTTLADTATINSVVSGSSGLTKAGAGTLVLGGANDYSGATTIGAGTLSISSDGNLGNTSNAVTLGGGTLQSTASVSLSSSRTLGGSGSLVPASGTTATFNGIVNAGTVAVSDTGTVRFAGSSNALSGLSFSSAGTLDVTGGQLALSGNVTTTHTAGTATIASANGVNLGATARTYTVGDGSSNTDLLFSANLSSTLIRLQKRGDGTLELTGNNSGLFGIQLGSQGATPAIGGRFLFNSASALGDQANQVQVNYGTLQATAAITSTAGISSGGRTIGFATLAGQDMTFSGTSSFFRATGTTGELILKANNHTTFSGNFAATSGTGTATGITFGGTGTLTLSGNNTALTESITIGDTLTLEAAGTGGNQALGGISGVAIQSGGTLLLSSSATNRINDTAGVTLVGGKLDTTGAGVSETLGVLTLSATSTINLGATTSVLNFADSSAATWGSGLTLTVSNWSGSATDQIFFGNSSSSLSPTQLSEISFIDPAGFATGSYGALLLGSGELVPVPEPSCVAVAAGLLGIAGWRERRRAAVARRAY